MCLANGRYIITSVPGNRFIGRAPVETLGVLDVSPKKVFALSEGLKAPIVSLFTLNDTWSLQPYYL